MTNEKIVGGKYSLNLCFFIILYTFFRCKILFLAILDCGMCTDADADQDTNLT